MWKIQYTHFVIVPGIAVAASILVFFGFWQGVPHSGGQTTEKVSPQNTPSFCLYPFDWTG